MKADGSRSVRVSAVRHLILAAGIGAAGLLLTLAVARARGGFDHEIFDDAPAQPRIVQGFSRTSPRDGLDGAAVRTEAYLRLRRLNRAAGWHVSFAARSARAAGTTVTVTVDDRQVLRQPLRSDWTPVEFAIPPRPAPGAVIGFSVESTGTARPAVISDVHFRSSSWFWLNRATIGASLVLSLLVALLLASSQWEWRAVAAGTMALVAQALLLTRGLGEGDYVPWTAMWGLCAVGLGAAANIWLRRSPGAWRHWRAAITLAAAVIAVHGWVLGHPLLGVGDSLFHRHRFQSVQDGAYFFTSEAPGGEFPYPIALYVLALPLAAIVEDTQWLLRAIAIVAHGAAGLAFFAAVARWRSPGEAFWALVIFFAAPVGYHTFAVAYLTNSVGQSLSVMALAAAVAWPFDRRPRAGVVALAMIAALAFLTHFGAFLVLGACLAAFAGLLFIAESERGRARAIAWATAGAVVLSVVVFYGWFGSTYRAMLSRPAAVVASADGPVPVMRREAHQTQYVPGLPALRARLEAVPRYVERYYGWWLLPLAAVGWWGARGRPRDPLDRLIAGWIAVSACFFVLGHVSSVDVRYYLGAYPAFAALGAQGQSAGATSRMIAAALLTYGAITAITYWLSWLGAWP
jgi:hypothetical protein